MRVQVEKFTKQKLIDIYYYNIKFSIKNAIETNEKILSYIDFLENFSYKGRMIPEINNRQFREIIYKQNRYVGYRIMYYISLIKETIYVFNIMSTRQDFNQILNEYNFFNNYLNS